MNRLLLIDDEPDILRVLSRSLCADGYEVLTAQNGKEGLAVFQKERPAIILTDIKMPGMDGIEVLKAIKKQDEDAEVIIITGHGDIDNAIEALKYGASDFINKPIRDEALSLALKRAEEKIRMRRQLKEYTVNLEKKVEEATRELRRKTNFMEKLIRSSNDGIVATDERFAVVIYNPGAQRIFGYRAEEVIQKMDAASIVPQELLASLRQEPDQGDRDAELPWQETTVPVREGSRIPVRFAGTLLHEKKKVVGSVLFFQDMREIKRLEKELVHAERLAAVGQTVAGLAHGIKNILHGLKGGSYLVDIGIEKDKPDKLRTGWDMIQRNIGRTADLVMDLLSYAKEREPEYERCRPNEIAEDVGSLVAEEAEKNDISIQLDLDPAVDEVVMDPRTIHTVLLNLVSNAVDACIFDENTGKQWQVRIGTARAGDGLIRFSVSDTGSGMSEEVREKLFTSFFSTKGHRGTGLGLLVTRKLVEEHGGKIDVGSTPGKGTTFTVQLPERPAEDESLKEDKPQHRGEEEKDEQKSSGSG
jgi:PAS domain S-box-containing protein